MSEYKIFNADVLVRDPDVTVDDLIDAIEGNRKYIRCLYVINKIDTISIEEVDEMARRYGFKKTASCGDFLPYEVELPLFIRENVGKVGLSAGVYQKEGLHAGL